ncbi:DinB family protein [Glutamicibacter endophyticus]|uniref:DinB family protein n=1 Tax=Glutamicibacter endophyticus TaxID=1522174 RepID=UPI003AF10532
MSTTMVTPDTTLTGERADLHQALANARHFLKFTTRELSDDQARLRTTASALTLGGLIKHVTGVEEQWRNFIVQGRAAMGWDGMGFSTITEEMMEAFHEEFRMNADETLAGLLQRYDEVAAATDELLATVDLDQVHELPQAPWFTGTHWSVRRTLLHIIAETTQHAGHADIIRESLDGAKSMG